MKSTIIINIDTENKQRITFSKPIDYPKPTIPEEGKSMLISDVTHVCEALYVLIDMCDQYGYAKKEDLIRTVNENLSTMLNNEIKG
jgi:hypothetical protein